MTSPVMHIHSRYVGVAVLAIVAAAVCSGQARPRPAPPLLMTVAAFPDGGDVPDKYSCTSQPAPGDPHPPGSISPAVSWSQVPAGTQSFLLLVHDPEPHPGKGLTDITHWLIWDIPASATGLPEGVLPGGTLADGSHQLKGNANNPIAAYRGPCAPPGPDHHYTWELWALDAKLQLGEDASRADVMKAADGHILGAALWIGKYHRTE